jgi:site-specific recombinase XerD
LDGLTREGVEAYLSHVAAQPNERRGGALSASYVEKHRQALRLLARMLRESGGSALDVPPRARHRALPLPQVEVLTRAEVSALYAECASDVLGLRDRALLAACYGCGLRRSEAVGLDAADVLHGRGVVYLRRGKNYRERYVPMAVGAARDLAAWLHEGRPVLAHPREAALFVSARSGRRLGGQSLLARLKALCGGVPSLRGRAVGLHTLRHSVATHLMQAGVRLEEIAAFLGHSSLESTQRYTHLMQDERFC